MRRPRDDDESISKMEPLIVPEGMATEAARDELSDLAGELIRKSSRLDAQMPAAISTSLKSLLRNMNCYYSNLIEGHNTHPVDIDRAMSGDYDAEPRKRNLQLEAAGHIAVQERIESGELAGAPYSQELILAIHEAFYRELPRDLKQVSAPSGKTIQVLGGQYRTTDVMVGRHTAISPGAIERFMIRYHQAYSRLGAIKQLVNAGAAHHRLAWIHCFLDGNGRVARLHSQYVIDQLSQTHGLWSISRGLARSVDQYKALLQNCDELRRGTSDGRGNLSQSALIDFNRYFLKTAIDQVEFMSRLLDPSNLKVRIEQWCQEQNLPSGARQMFTSLIYCGEMRKQDIFSLFDEDERTVRRHFKKWRAAGIIREPNQRIVELAFPAAVAEAWFPGLYPN